MSGRDAEERADAARVRARLEAYYGRYYGGTLGIPGWRELVAVRLDDVAYERERLTRLELALGRSVAGARRSEEHTSELQSRLHLVCRLLLEKKKQTQWRIRHS